MNPRKGHISLSEKKNELRNETARRTRSRRFRRSHKEFNPRPRLKRDFTSKLDRVDKLVSIRALYNPKRRHTKPSCAGLQALERVSFLANLARNELELRAIVTHID